MCRYGDLAVARTAAFSVRVVEVYAMTTRPVRRVMPESSRRRRAPGMNDGDGDDPGRMAVLPPDGAELEPVLSKTWSGVRHARSAGAAAGTGSQRGTGAGVGGSSAGKRQGGAHSGKVVRVPTKAGRPASARAAAQVRAAATPRLAHAPHRPDPCAVHRRGRA